MVHEEADSVSKKRINIAQKLHYIAGRDERVQKAGKRPTH